MEMSFSTPIRRSTKNVTFLLPTIILRRHALIFFRGPASLLFYYGGRPDACALEVLEALAAL